MSAARPSDQDPLQRAEASLPGRLGRLFSSLRGGERPLAHIQVEVTSHCPGACVYCPRGVLKEAWRPKRMEDETYAALVPLMRLSRRVHLQGWGEPFTHPRLLDYVALARKAGCQASTTSCGLVMNEKLAGGIAASGMDILAFSLAGTDEISNAARKNVPFSGVEKAVRLVREAKRELGVKTPAIHLSYILLADRLDAAARLPELMDKWDVPVCVVSTLDMPVLESHWSLAYRPDERGKIERARDLLEETAARAAADGRTIRFCLPGKETGNCREDIAHSCYVDADGVLSPCIYLNVPCRQELEELRLPGDRALVNDHRRTCGNVREEDPALIWKKEDYADFRADLEHGMTPPTCLHCPKRFEHMF